MISMLMVVASMFSMLCTACDDDDEPNENPIVKFEGEYSGTVTASAEMRGQTIVLDAEDLTITVKKNKGDNNIVLGIGATTGMGTKVNPFEIEATCTIEGDKLTINPLESFSANDGNYDILGSIESGYILGKEMELTYFFKPGKAPVNIKMQFSTKKAE